MSANFGADAVFERSDDFSAGGVVFGICGKDQEDIERKAQGVTFNLNVALLHDVEEADLDFSCEVGQLMDGQNAAIGTGQQAVVNSQLIGEIAAATCGANGIDVTDDVGDGYVGSG